MSDNAARKFSNPFANEAPERSPSITVARQNMHVRRTGIIPLCIGASRIVPMPDKSKRQFEARELRLEAARAQQDGRELSVSVMCFELRRVFPSLEAFVAELPPLADMKREELAFTWAYWCDDTLDPKSVETAAALGAEIKALSAAHTNLVQAIGKMSNVEEIMTARERAEKIKAMIVDTKAKKKTEEEAIIGLMSDTPLEV